MTAPDRPSSRGAVRRRSRPVAVVAAVAVAALVLGALAWWRHDDGTYVVPPDRASSATGAVEQPGQAAAALVAWQRAITARRPQEAPGPAARTAAANALRLRVQNFSARYVARSGAVAADGSWTAGVDLSWRFGGVDATEAHEEVGVTFTPTGTGAVRIGAFGHTDDRLPLWLTGPVRVRRTGDTMVVLAGSGAGAARRLDGYGRLAARAVATVRRVVPWPHPDLVLEVPADETGLERMMGVASGSYSGVAAVTASVDGTAGGPVHVLVNPQVIGGLNTQGAQIVLSHEAVHAATHVADTAMPSWLLEGFADYVALRDVPLPLGTTARQILAEVRRDGPPRRLPGAAEFDDRSESFGAEYEAAWLACRLLARIGGEPALVRLYDAVRDGAGLDATLRREIGLGVHAFTARWRHELAGLAHA